MNNQQPEHVLVISDKPVFREVIKNLLQKKGWAEIAMAPDEQSAASMIAEQSPTVILLDRPNTSLEKLDFLFKSPELKEVIILGWSENKLAVYRHQLMEATTDNLTDAIKSLHQSVLLKEQ